jgi:hypothetical protein
MLPAIAGWQQRASEWQPQIAIHRTVSRLFFFLPTFDETTTELHLHAEKLTETILHLTLGHYVEFYCIVLFCFVLFCFFPLWWNNDRTISETPSPGLEAVGLTPKLIRLKLHCIWTWRVFFHLFIIYFFFNPFFVSLMLFQHTIH